MRRRGGGEARKLSSGNFEIDPELKSKLKSEQKYNLNLAALLSDAFAVCTMFAQNFKGSHSVCVLKPAFVTIRLWFAP